jgi:iron(III) transport system permease protein
MLAETELRPLEAPEAQRQLPLTRLVHSRVSAGIPFALLTAVVVYLAIIPVGTLLVASFRSNFLGVGADSWTTQNYVDTLSGPGFGTLVRNSLEYALLVTLFANTIGMGIAWLYARTNAPAKGFTLAIVLVPLMIPTLIYVVAWILLLDPHSGAVNIALSDVGLPKIAVYSMTSMVIVQSLHMIPLAFLIGLSVMTSIDRTLEEAAATCGARPGRVFRSIVFPIVRSGTLGSALLIFVLTTSSFEVPQLIGVPGRRYVFTTEIYNGASQFPVKYGTVGVLGTVVLAITLTGLVLSKKLGSSRSRETITGKGFRPSIIDLGPWRWVAMRAARVDADLVVVAARLPKPVVVGIP